MKVEIRQKEEKGITLIALVITIIVLLILAAVSIVTLTGENGVLIQTSTAKEETRGASVQEARDLWKINQKTDNYTENGTAPSLKELIDNLVKQGLLTEDERDQILGNDLKGIEATYQVTIGSRTIVFENMAVNYLKVGDYVNYIDNDENKRKCIVLYDRTYNDANETNYGVQLITVNTVEDVTLGGSDFDTAKASYNNAITILNTRANAYLNTTYASSARCAGSIPDNPSLESGYYTSSPMATINGMFRDADTNYMIDKNQINTLNVSFKWNVCWAASRYLHSSINVSSFGVRTLGYIGYPTNTYFCGSYSGTGDYYESIIRGLVPVFTLKSGIIVSGGEGTESSPYELGIL